jgi:hypothetical protein
MDEDWRELERRWSATPDDDELLEHAVRARARAGLEPTRAMLLAQEPWRRLVDLCRDWTDRPLEPSDGLGPEAVLAAEERLGYRLPKALHQWFTLVGNRPDLCTRSNQNRAVPPERLVVRPSSSLLYLFENDQAPPEIEPIGGWGIRPEDCHLDDPEVFDSGFARNTALPQRLSDALVGYAHCERLEQIANRTRFDLDTGRFRGVKLLPIESVGVDALIEATEAVPVVCWTAAPGFEQPWLYRVGDGLIAQLVTYASTRQAFATIVSGTDEAWAWVQRHCPGRPLGSPDLGPFWPNLPAPPPRPHARGADPGAGAAERNPFRGLNP